MIDRSRTPASDICSVRGIGVAVIDRTSMPIDSCFSRSFAATPKRCSSSTTRSPRFLKRDVLREQPVRADDQVDLAGGERAQDGLACRSAVRKRETISSFTGNGANRSLIVSKCCAASTVVGRQERDLLSVHDRP